MAKRECYIAEYKGMIYGAGSSRSAAMKDANEWMDNDPRGIDAKEWTDNNTPEITLIPATSALCRFIRKHGVDESRVRWTGGTRVGLKRRR